MQYFRMSYYCTQAQFNALVNAAIVHCTIQWYTWLVGCIEDLRRFTYAAVFRPYSEQISEIIRRERESNPGPLGPQAKSLTTRPPLHLNGIHVLDQCTNR